MNTLIEEGHKHSEKSIKVEVSRRTQKLEVQPANEKSGFLFVGTDCGQISGSIVGNEFGVMLRRKGRHKSEFAYNVVRKHSSHDIQGLD